MSEWAALLAALVLGLVSSAHCVGMCGGIMGALTMAIPAEARQRRTQLLLSYNVGRIASYTLMGLLVGAFAGVIAGAGGASWLRVLAGLLLIAMGLYLADWWRGLTYLERVGRYLWAYLQPLGKGLFPVTTPRKAVFLGALWGWLPCGLVYTALAYAMAQAQPAWSAAVMLAFGLGTLPAVFATGYAAHQLTALLQQRAVRTGLALVIMLFGVWTLAGGSHGAHEHQHHEPALVPGEHAPEPHHPHHHHH